MKNGGIDIAPFIDSFGPADAIEVLFELFATFTDFFLLHLAKSQPFYLALVDILAQLVHLNDLRDCPKFFIYA